MLKSKLDDDELSKFSGRFKRVAGMVVCVGGGGETFGRIL